MRTRSCSFIVSSGWSAPWLGPWLVSLAAASTLTIAASPPSLLTYQGVLRDSTNAPVTGSRDMELRFWSAPVGGDEILVDRHLSANGQSVAFSGGLFRVQLGGGAVSDGPGPGRYGSVTEVFRDYSAVYLEVSVAGETLSPRVRILASAFSLNADLFDGKDSSTFLDTSSTSQTKIGSLSVNSTLTGSGAGAGAYFVGSSRVDLQACKLEYSIVSPK